MTDRMTSLLLHREGDSVRASFEEQPSVECSIGGEKYYAEPDYFGEWAPLLNGDDRIVGFTIIPTVADDYLEQHVLRTRFIRSSSNVVVDRGDYTYIRIHLFNTKEKAREGMNRIEASLLRGPKGEIAFRLDGILPQDVPQLELISRQSEWH